MGSHAGSSVGRDIGQMACAEPIRTMDRLAVEKVGRQLSRPNERSPSLHLFLRCGGDGTAVGSALFVAHHELGERRAA